MFTWEKSPERNCCLEFCWRKLLLKIMTQWYPWFSISGVFSGLETFLILLCHAFISEHADWLLSLRLSKACVLIGGNEQKPSRVSRVWQKQISKTTRTATEKVIVLRGKAKCRLWIDRINRFDQLLLKSLKPRGGDTFEIHLIFIPGFGSEFHFLKSTTWWRRFKRISVLSVTESTVVFTVGLTLPTTTNLFRRWDLCF